MTLFLSFLSQRSFIWSLAPVDLVRVLTSCSLSGRDQVSPSLLHPTPERGITSRPGDISADWEVLRRLLDTCYIIIDHQEEEH